MRMCDNKFWHMMSGEIKRMLQWNTEQFDVEPTRTVEDMHKCLMENLLRTNFMGFFRFIGVNAPVWP